MKRAFSVFAAIFAAVLAVSCGEIKEANEEPSPVVNTDVQKAAVQPEEAVAVAEEEKTEDLTQAQIFDRMVNSINFFDTVQGRFVSTDITAEYRSDLTTNTAEANIFYTVVGNINKLAEGDFSQAEKSYDHPFVIQACDGNRSVRVLPQYKTYTEFYTTPHEAEKMYISGDRRVGKQPDGQMGFWLIDNPLNIDEASLSVFPQEITLGYLYDFDLWQIDGTQEYLGRECVAISGNPDESYGRKLGVSRFEFLVDAQTGVLLKYIGYDENKKIVDFIITEEFSVNEPIGDVTLPDLSEYEHVR